MYLQISLHLPWPTGPKTLHGCMLMLLINRSIAIIVKITRGGGKKHIKVGGIHMRKEHLVNQRGQVVPCDSKDIGDIVEMQNLLDKFKEDKARQKERRG